MFLRRLLVGILAAFVYIGAAFAAVNVNTASQAELEARLLDATAREQRQAAREAALEQQLVRLRTEYASDDGTPA